MGWEQLQAKTKRFSGEAPVTGARRDRLSSNIALDSLYDRKTLFIPAYCCTHMHPFLTRLFPVFHTVSKRLCWQDLPKQGSRSTRHSYAAIMQLGTSILLSGCCFHMTCSS